MNKKEYTDEQLVVNFLSGDEKALEELFDRYLKPIYCFITKFTGSTKDAEDITQEVFVRAWKNLKSFDQRKSFKSWIFTIARNAAINFLKKTRFASGEKKMLPFSIFTNEEGENAITETFADPAPLPPQLFERKELNQMLSETLDQLSPIYRTVLLFRYNDHFSFREIADLLDEPIHTVKSRHRRALIKLKDLLSDKI